MLHLNQNNDEETRKYLALGYIFWFAMILGLLFLTASCRSKKTTVETSKIEVKEIVKDSSLIIKTSDLKIEKTVPVFSDNFYPYDTTRTDNPIFENEINNGHTKVRISSTKKGLRITTESKPVENKQEKKNNIINNVKVRETEKKEANTSKTNKVIVPIYFQWWFWLLIVILSVILRYFVLSKIFPDKENE
ncbi:hypothetical protein [Flavobacterium suncheonense]|uniref:Uncharacterized protein n=1 Tax=Flavobacterium suncheonense GH29-5 = DSM 17707 TaxID=1121899 RepID=A0A0A2MA43_9FLAO|nr:hypothetical protein [Flavobacterium suncheonense]KGO89542.1 hypothetical protein Q764_07160 [Flavobacterium suncheonense GH29-5 = DSM 17707]